MLGKDKVLGNNSLMFSKIVVSELFSIGNPPQISLKASERKVI